MNRWRGLERASLFGWGFSNPCIEHAGAAKMSPFCFSTSVYAPKLSSIWHDAAPCARRLLFSKWVTLASLAKHDHSSKIIACYSVRAFLSYNLRVTCVKSIDRGFCTDRTTVSRSILQAQAALLDYLHCTRGLDFMDAEHVSRNSPIFLAKLLKLVNNDEDIGRSLARFLCYHPINEFEPFFESLGLKPSEFNSFLPRDLTFLRDDSLLMDNFHVLCNYGIPRAKIGRIYSEAVEVFRYSDGVLASKLQAYEGIGLCKSDVINIVSVSPLLLIGDVNREFVKFLEELESLGVNRGWIGKNVFAKHTYNWQQMTWLLNFVSEVGVDKMEMGMLIRREPSFLLDGSGKMTFQVVGIFVKLGFTRSELLSLFLQFPQVQVVNYLKSLRKALKFLIEIDMECEDIRNVVRSHPQQLGSCVFLEPVSVLRLLAVGKKRLCEIIKDEPYKLLDFVKGSKLEPLSKSRDDQRKLAQKKFQASFGIVENIKEMENALSIVQGSSDEFQQKYDYLIKKGFCPDDIIKMIKEAPLVLRQRVKDLKCKVDFFVDELGYPVKLLLMRPRCLQFSMERLKVRFLMYHWLKNEGKLKRTLCWSTILHMSDESFIKRYVKRHPKGLEVWDKFRRAVYTC